MTDIRTRVRVGSDGNITIPVGVEEAGAEVEVVVTPAAPTLTQEEYQAIIRRTAGSIPDLERPPQWVYAKREPLD
jgi:hypothetical protein